MSRTILAASAFCHCQSIICRCLAGQQHLKIDMKNLTNRLLKAEQKQSAVLSEVQQVTAGIAQLKASSRGMQKQVEGQQAKLQQEIKGLGQDVEQLKGTIKKGPGAIWQRAQEQVGQTASLHNPVWDMSGMCEKRQACYYWYTQAGSDSTACSPKQSQTLSMAILASCMAAFCLQKLQTWAEKLVGADNRLSIQPDISHDVNCTEGQPLMTLKVLTEPKHGCPKGMSSLCNTACTSAW